MKKTLFIAVAMSVLSLSVQARSCPPPPCRPYGPYRPCGPYRPYRPCDGGRSWHSDDWARFGAFAATSLACAAIAASRPVYTPVVVAPAVPTVATTTYVSAHAPVQVVSYYQQPVYQTPVTTVAVPTAPVVATPCTVVPTAPTPVYSVQPSPVLYYPQPVSGGGYIVR